jgi:hypothetical protein
LQDATVSDNRQHGSDMQPKGILEMSRDHQELRAIRHHPKLRRSKAVARGAFAQPGRYHRGGAENSALVAKVNHGYGTSFAVSAPPVQFSERES